MSTGITHNMEGHNSQMYVKFIFVLRDALKLLTNVQSMSLCVYAA
jgi:hypothetical protein